MIEADIAPLQAGAASGELSSLSGEPPSLTGEPPSLSGDAVPGGEAAFRKHVPMKPAFDESDFDGEVMGPPKKVPKRTLARHDSACSSFSLLDDISDEEPVGEDVQLGDAEDGVCDLRVVEVDPSSRDRVTTGRMEMRTTQRSK